MLSFIYINCIFLKLKLQIYKFYTNELNESYRHQYNNLITILNSRYDIKEKPKTTSYKISRPNTVYKRFKFYLIEKIGLGAFIFNNSRSRQGSLQATFYREVHLIQKVNALQLTFICLL